MTTDLREALDAAFEKESGDESQNTPVEVETTPSTESQESAEPAPVESASDESTETPPADTTGKKADPAPVQAAPEEAKGIHRVDRAPASWKKEAKSDWNSLPLQARQEIHRREMEVQRVLNETAPIRQEAQQFRETVTPYMARIQSLGVTPHQAVGELLKADYLLATGSPSQKAMFIDKLLQDYNVDINELDSAIAKRMGIGGQQAQANAPQFDPNQVSRLVQQQLQQALAPIYQQQQLQQQEQTQQVVRNVENMALDPKYPHFETVRQDMADLMDFYASKREPLYLSLDEAYSRAISMRPDISAMQQATQMNQQAQKAASAAASISGAPVGGGNQHQASSGNLRADIEAAFGGSRV
jgi:hypothetical protein